MRALGVDPGVRAGLAIVSFENGVPEIIEAINIPTVGTGATERVDVLAIHSFIEAHTPQHALIERAQAMPKQGASSGLKYGRAVGALEAVIACCAMPMTIVEPSTWRKFHHLHVVTKSPLGSAHCSCSRTHARCSPERRITAAPRLR